MELQPEICFNLPQGPASEKNIDTGTRDKRRQKQADSVRGGETSTGLYLGTL